MTATKLYQYDDYEAFDYDFFKYGGRVSFSLNDDKNNLIEFKKEIVTNFKSLFSKSLFIIEGKITLNQKGNIALLNWQKKNDKSLTKKVTLKYHDAKTVIREINFTASCISYSEYFDNLGNLFFELVLHDTTINPFREKVIKYYDYSIHMELFGDLKKLSPSNAFWSTSGIILGTGAVAGAFITGAWTIPVILTIIYGTNTVITCSYDLLVDYQENDSQIGTLNVVKNTIFGESFNFIGKILKINKKEIKKVSNIFYSGSEIMLGLSGVKELGTKLIFGKARGFYAVNNIKKVKGNYGIMKEIGISKLNYQRYGYDLYRLVNGSNDIKNYSVGIFKEVKKTGDK